MSRQAFAGKTAYAEPEGSWNLAVRNDYAKALHAALLLRLGVEQTRVFWAGHPLPRNGVNLSERELVDHIASETATSPVGWAMGLVNAVEPFLIERGIDFIGFVETTRRFANHGSFIQTRHLLKWLAPILVPMFRFGDPHRLILHGARLVATRMSAGVDFRLVRWRGAPSDERKRTGSVWASYPGLMAGHIPAWDFAMSPGLDMIAAPNIFGVPPFDSLVVICDARAVESVPWDVACHCSGDRFAIDGVTHGRCLKLGQFLADNGYDIAEIRAPNVEVVAIDRDYRCPSRGRTVLSAGTAYGTPGYLARLAWSSGHSATRNFLSFVHDELGEDADATQALLDTLHKDYLTAITDAIKVVYFRADGSIEVAGRHVCGGVAARLLFECVGIACNEGRHQFTFRELKRLPSLISHPKNTGFETRLQRLRSALESASCGLTIELTGRGRFALKTSGRLELEDRTAPA